MTLKLTQIALITPAQSAWCAAAPDAHRHAFILEGEIKILAGLARDRAPAFCPVIHGIRVRLDDQPLCHPSVWDALAAGQRLKEVLRADLSANGVTLPDLDLVALGLEDAPDDEEAEIEDEQDLVLAMLGFQDLELLEPPALGKPSLDVNEARVNVMPSGLPGTLGMKSRAVPLGSPQEGPLNPYARLSR